MSISCIRIHVFDGNSKESLPKLYDCIQVLRLSELHKCFEGDPVRTLIRPVASLQLPQYVEYQIEVQTPFIGEVSLYDPPKELWPDQEWALLRPGRDEDFRIAVYPDATSWPANGREKLREVLLRNASSLGSYSVLKGRFIAPEGPPFYEYCDTQVWLQKAEGPETVGRFRLYPGIYPESMAEPWYDVPIPPGTWDLVAAGARIETWTVRLDLAPGQSMDLGDVRLKLRDSRES